MTIQNATLDVQSSGQKPVSNALPDFRAIMPISFFSLGSVNNEQHQVGDTLSQHRVQSSSASSSEKLGIARLQVK
jgi:hypothetical protein